MRIDAKQCGTNTDVPLQANFGDGENAEPCTEARFAKPVPESAMSDVILSITTLENQVYPFTLGSGSSSEVSLTFKYSGSTPGTRD